MLAHQRETLHEVYDVNKIYEKDKYLKIKYNKGISNRNIQIKVFDVKLI